ncbi:MAG: ABC transporter substrate-binding protein [Oceanicola sp.]|nr:ABC transporter substrate-binding protein [Oceanicola sp.]
MKRIAFASALALGAAGATSAAADCGEVSITEMDWASSAVVTYVSKFLMEQGYGCTVQVVPSSTTPAVASLAETGEPDLVTELWAAYTPAYFDLKEQGKVVELANVLVDGGVEGWWIPQYLAEEHPELTTIEGILANPELVGGRFHDCPDGWGCNFTNHSNLKASGLLDAGIERFQHGSGETLATAIAAAYEDKAPWFGYYWAPTSVLGSYPMVQVDMGPYNEEAHTCNVKDDCPTPAMSSYPTAIVLTVATTSFANEEPEIAELMSKVTFTNAQMGEILAWQEAQGASYEEAAVYFLSNYPETWGAWLNDAARDKLSALLE